MNCPTLEALGCALDLDPEEPDHIATQRHLRTCPDCEANAAALRDVELVLGQPDIWGQETRGCLSAGEMLRLLAGEVGAREGHVAVCQPCQQELKALRQNEREPEVASASLRERLRSLSPQNASTEELLTPRRSRRRSGAGRVSGAGRTSGTGRTKSGRGTGRYRRSSRRSRSGAVRRSNLLAPQSAPSTPTWAWGVLAAAAALLVAVAVAVSPSSNHDAVADASYDEPSAPVGPRVSDVQHEPRPRQPEPASEPAEVEPSYPLPSQLPADTDDETEAPVVDEPRNEPEPEAFADARDATPSTPETETRQRPVPEDTDSEPKEAEASEALPPVVDDGGRLELASAHLNGSLHLERDGERTRLSRRTKGMQLRPGDVIRAKNGGFLSLEGGAYELCLDKDTELRVRGAASGPVLDLTRGRVLAEVATLPSGQQFRVLTRQGEFSVLGTVFAVEAAPTSSRLLVAEGTVSAGNGLGSVKVPAGMGVDLAPKAAPGEPATIRAADLAWTQSWAPKRAVLYGVRFDDNKTGGFKGELSDATGKPSGRALVLPTLDGNRYWGLCGMVQKDRMSGFRAKRDTFVAVSLRSDEPVAVLLQCFNDSQKKEFKRSFAHPGGGVWKTFTVPLMELSTYYDPGKNPVRENDLFVDLEVYAGQPGTKARVLLDDVSIYRKVYR